MPLYYTQKFNEDECMHNVIPILECHIDSFKHSVPMVRNYLFICPFPSISF